MRTATAQDLEPRAYTAAPTGVNFLVVAAGVLLVAWWWIRRSRLTTSEATIDSLGIGLGRTIDLFGRTALILAVVPVRMGRHLGQRRRGGATMTRSAWPIRV